MPHAFHAWVVNRVIDDPVVNGLALSQRVLDASNGAFGCTAHDPVVGNQFRRLQRAPQDFGSFCNGTAPGDVEVAVLCGDVADDLQFRFGDSLGPVRVEDFHVGYRVTIYPRRCEIALPMMAERTFPRGVTILHQWQPYASFSLRVVERDCRMDVVTAPLRERFFRKADGIPRRCFA